VGVGHEDLAEEIWGNWLKPMEENNHRDPLAQMIQFLASRQKQAPAPGWAGFKYMPFYYDPETYGLALQWLGQRGVKVIYNFRNPLDVLLSIVKHRYMGEGMQSECVKGDSECLAKHKRLQLTMPTGPKLLQEPDDAMHIRDLNLQHAAQFHVPFLSLDYADLAEGSEGERLSHLQLIADFLCVDRRLTVKDLAVNTVNTAPPRQADQIANYAQVVQTLNGTKYQSLLH
jgi:hypothetical protein